jgi:formamidopyrimidine-DNA glycosylase
MPELPEVETTRRGIEPYVTGQTIREIIVREPRLRWRVPRVLARELPGKTIVSVTRRGKYLLFDVGTGSIIVHLGMSGSLTVVPQATPAGKFDHVDVALESGDCLRLRDPRRFGAVLWTRADVTRHKLLAPLGPEPLNENFNGTYLFRLTRVRTRAIRDVLLDGHTVAGVGNIYANEALHAAGIRPARAAARITRMQYDALVETIRATLTSAILAGGTTLRDFRNPEGNPGYFSTALKVYGRAGKPCLTCGSQIKAVRLGQRRAFYCRTCQL